MQYPDMKIVYKSFIKMFGKYVDKFDKSWWECNCKNERITIIGNIHDNPELLNQEL